MNDADLVYSEEGLRTIQGIVASDAMTRDEKLMVLETIKQAAQTAQDDVKQHEQK